MAHEVSSRGMPTGIRPLVGKAGWGVADQALSSLTNLALGVVVARAVGAGAFGAFGIAFATYTLALGLTRAVNSEPLAVRFSSGLPGDWLDATASAAGAALTTGVSVGVVCLVVAGAAGGTLRTCMLLLAALLPGLLLQDSFRYAFFAKAAGASAFANDLVWAGALAAGLTALYALDALRLAPMLAIWGGAAWLAAVFGCYQVRVLPRPQRTIGWWRSQSDLAPRYLFEFVAITGAIQLTVYVVGAVGGLGDAGAIRGAQILLGPVYVLLVGMSLFGVAEGVRILESAPERFVRVAVATSVALVAATLAWGVLVVAIPDSLGRRILGDSWTGASGAFLGLCVAWAGWGASTGAALALRALAAARRSMSVYFYLAPATVLLGTGGALVDGAAGASWGMAAAFWLSVVLWWRQLAAALEERSQPDGRSHRAVSES